MAQLTQHSVTELFLIWLRQLHSKYHRFKVRFSFDYAMKDIDWTTMLLLFWIIFGLFVYATANIISLVIDKRQQDISSNERKKSLKSESEVKSDNINAVVPEATGPDVDCVQWINNIIRWLFTHHSIIKQHVISVWLSALNDKAKNYYKEVSIKFINLSLLL